MEPNEQQSEETINLPSAGEMESMIWSDDDKITEEKAPDKTTTEEQTGEFVLPHDLSGSTTITEEGEEQEDTIPEFPDYTALKQKLNGPASEQVEVMKEYANSAFEASQKYQEHFEKLKSREQGGVEEKTQLEKQIEELKFQQSSANNVATFNTLIEQDEEIKEIQQEAGKLINSISRKAPAFQVDWQKLLEGYASLPHDQPEKLSEAIKTFKDGLSEIREEYAGHEDAILDVLADGMLVKDRADKRMTHIRENLSTLRYEKATEEYKQHLEVVEKWQSSFDVKTDDPNDPVRLAIAVINVNPKVRQAVKKQHEASIKHCLPVNPDEWKADPSKSISLAQEHAKVSAQKIRKMRQLAARAIAYESIIPELQKRNRTLSARLKDHEQSQPPPPSGESKTTHNDEPHIPSAEEMNEQVYR